MKSRNWVLLVSIITAVASSAYSILPILVSLHSGTFKPGQLGRIVVLYPGTTMTIPVAFAFWIAVGYQLLQTGHRKILKILLTNFSGAKDNWVIYNVFKGRGWGTRISILEALGSPKLRNEIAKVIEKDWRETDRNIRILESAGLVKVQSVHNSIVLYELTESGKDLLQTIMATLSSTSLTSEVSNIKTF